MSYFRYTLNDNYNPAASRNVRFSVNSDVDTSMFEFNGNYGYRDNRNGGARSIQDDQNSSQVTFNSGLFADFSDNTVHVDLLGGNVGDVLFAGTGNDQLNGGGGDDVLAGGAGADAIDGGDGIDTVSYETSAAGVIARLGNAANNRGDAAGDTYTSIENLTGSNSNDALYGTDDSGANVISGLGGNDTIYLGAGDTALGGAGDDLIFLSTTSGAPVTIDGGTQVDQDTINFSVNAAVTIAITAGEGGSILLSRDGTAFASTTGIENTEIKSFSATRIEIGAVASRFFFDSGSGTFDNVVDASAAIAATSVVFDGRTGSDTFIGGAGAEELRFSSTGAFVANLSGSSKTIGGVEYASGDVLDTYGFVDRVTGAVDRLSSTSNADSVVYTGDNATRIDTGGGRDLLVGGAGNDSLWAGGGNDTLIGGGGGDFLFGDSGFDTVSYETSTTAVTAYVDRLYSYLNTGDATGDRNYFIEGLTGGSAGDTLFGDANANALNGGGGDDVLDGGLGADALDGGDGTDTASYARAGAGVTAILRDATGNLGEAAGDTYAGIENLTGSDHADTLVGSADSVNVLTGGAGNDALWGAGEGDTLIGGAGNDKFYVDASFTKVDGGTGTDSLVARVAADGEGLLLNYDDLTGIESVVLKAGANLTIAPSETPTTAQPGLRFTVGTTATTYTELHATDGKDVITATGSGRGFVDGAGGDDTITLGGSSLSATGGAGNDRITGSSLESSIYGEDGNDTLFGGSGDTVIAGGAGADRMTGGSGADTFVFDSLTEMAGDKIFAFDSAGGDRIDLSNLESRLSKQMGQAVQFEFIEGSRFSKAADAFEVRAVVKSNGDTTLQFDLDHDGKADATLFVRLTGGADGDRIDATDFLHAGSADTQMLPLGPDHMIL